MSISRSKQPAGPRGAQPTRIIQPVLFAPLELVIVQEARVVVRVNDQFDGWQITAVAACITGQQSSSGAVQIQIRNITQANIDVLSAPIQIDVATGDSHDSANPPIIISGNSFVNARDLIAFDIDSAGTGVKGLNGDVTLTPP